MPLNPLPVGDPFGDVMNNMRKVVVSTTLKSAERVAQLKHHQSEHSG